MSKTKPNRDGRIRILTVNVHVGLVIFAGALAWVLARTPGVHVVLVQEASRARPRHALLRTFKGKNWHRVGPGVNEAGLVGTYIFLKKSRFKLLDETYDHVSDFVSNMHPTRKLVAAKALDKRTGRILDISCVHTWHIVGRTLGAKGSISEGHIAQVCAHAEYHRASYEANPGSVQAAGGDWNERLNRPAQGRVDLSAIYLMRKVAKMVPAYRRTLKGSKKVSLDDVFVRPAPYVTVLRRRHIKIPFKVADHPAILVILGVRKL